MINYIAWLLNGNRSCTVEDNKGAVRAYIELNVVPLEPPWCWEVYKASGNMYDYSRAATKEEAMEAAEIALREINFNG